ncbi:dihydropyrimidine dehydrogenase [Sphingorhabdus lutea]|uniref:Dihydropyrimidine dehydrogenase n=1 Tax=Sphingorhabdus lutea TaxID=1913578 RepID=A0A1L3JF62_9SPHN|nr:NAD(P)-dependent oxidoreductase [Sphingorhabdus lutea]APG63775.1 dihydropyrimidine dehydrogenase [Sphingorhabdus lutea]
MAKEKLLKFVDVGQKFPEKRGAELRAKDFQEISNRYNDADANEQASRCSQCGVPYCTVHCPLHNHIPDWLKLTAEGRLQEAYEMSAMTSSMPEICGRICPQDRLCEGNCVIEFSGHDAVTIGSVEKYITDTAWENGWVEDIICATKTGIKVAIIGSGPGGLTAAEGLAALGHEIHIYERSDRAGGLLTYGIPGFKLEKEVVTRRIDRLKKAGIIFHLNADIGGDVKFSDLRKMHDMVLIATGVYKSREAKIKGEDASGVEKALDYLSISNRKYFGDDVPEFDNGRFDAKGKNIVVIGGGDTAMDCVRTAIRQGANSVKCLYRRDKENMPGSAREVKNAEEEGVEFVWLTSPAEIIVENGKAAGVSANMMRLGPPDSSGRRAPEIDPNGGQEIAADMVIMALGFEPENLPKLFDAEELAVTRWGTIRADHKNMMTNLDGVFAIGDIVRGASLVVWAIRDGRDVTQYMHQWAKSQKKAALAA